MLDQQLRNLINQYKILKKNLDLKFELCEARELKGLIEIIIASSSIMFFWIIDNWQLKSTIQVRIESYILYEILNQDWEKQN